MIIILDKELEELLSLRDNEYTQNNILSAKETLKEKLIKVNNLDINKRQDLLLFIDNMSY